MSWQFQGACYPSLLAANQAAASASSGVVSSGSVVVATSVTESTITFQATDLVSGAVASRTVAVDPLPCVLMDASDAQALGWLLLGAWASVYAIKFLARLVVVNVYPDARNDS